jgi:hypothetical protein
MIVLYQYHVYSLSGSWHKPCHLMQPEEAVNGYDFCAKDRDGRFQFLAVCGWKLKTTDMKENKAYLLSDDENPGGGSGENPPPPPPDTKPPRK